MKRIGALFVLVATVSVGCGEYNREAVDSNNQGMGFLRGNRYQDAREKFQRAAAEDPRYHLPLYNLALSYVRQREWSHAIDALDRAITRAPHNAEYHFQRGNAHYQIATTPPPANAAPADSSESGAHLEEARTSFRNAIRDSSSMYMAQFRLGQVSELLDDQQAALQAYTDCLRVAPRWYAAYARLGRIYQRNRLHEQAQQVLREGLRIAPAGVPERGGMHNQLGLVLLDQHQALPATEEFLAASREDPQMVQALFSLGMTFAEMPDKRQQAILYLQQFVQSRGGEAGADYITMATAKLGELQSAGN